MLIPAGRLVELWTDKMVTHASVNSRSADIIAAARTNVIQTLRDSMLVLDFEDHVIDLNQAAEQLIGQPLAAVAGQPLNIACPQIARQIAEARQAAGSPHEIKVENGGEEQVFDLHLSQVTDESGQSVGQVLLLHEVTERVRSEKQIRISEEYFRVLTENSTDIIIIVGEVGTILYVSSALERILGRTSSEVTGSNILELVHPEDIDQLFASLAESLDTPNISRAFSARIGDKHGRWRILECIANNLLDNPAVNGIVINARDVTERTEAEEALRKSEERYRLHFAHVGDVIFTYDIPSHLMKVSPSFETHLGYRPEELIGRPLAELPLLPAEYVEQAAASIQKILSGKTIDRQRYELIARDGARKIVEVSGNPILRDSQVIGVICVARDVTERVRAEDHIKASLQEKEILLKEIHHRVKNNLQIICSLLNLQSNTITDPQTLTHFQDSETRIRAMALIHERLYHSKDLGRIDFGPYLSDLTRSLIQTYGWHAQNTELEVEVDSVVFDIDTAVPCGLIVNELVSNALKHAFPNGRPGKVGVELRHDAEKGQCRLLIRDDGVGIANENLEQFTASLGLQLVHSLVGQLDGTLEVSGDSGTRFDITFPLAQASVDESIVASP